MASSDSVAGHFVRQGDAWEPMLADCSPLVQSIYLGDSGRVADLARSQPQVRDNILTLLYWASEPGVEAKRVSVKRRTPLMLAAEFGSMDAMNALLEQGADATARAPGEDGCTATEVR